jgi:hypothetical protein
MANLGLIKSYNAGGAITAFSIVKPGSNDYDVVLGAAGADKVIGVTREFAAASGEPVDVIHDGIANLKLGGTVTRGDLLMSDGSGFGIVASAGAGTNVRVIGAAIISGVSGDIIPVMVEVGSFQG